MSSNDSSRDSSLELLLDTICNTFGGVLFISLLVVILLNMTSKEAALEPPSETSQAELVGLQQELTESNRELRQLNQALQTQQRTESQILDPELEEMVRSLQASQEDRHATMDARNAHLEQTGDSQIETNRIARELAELDKAMERAQGSLAEAKRQREKEVEDRTRDSELPTPSITQKTPVALLLKAGRLCFYTKRNPDGGFGRNEAETNQIDEGGALFFEPKPNTGIQISLTGDSDDAIERRLDDFDKDSHYMKIIVWPDSFGHFSMVRNVMLHKGFEYLLLPLPEDERVFFGSETQEEVFH